MSSGEIFFSAIDLVFFDTTSLYFEGGGGQEIGRYGNSKDHRPDCKQMVVGLVLDREGWPLCCHLWPGNTADVSALLPVVARLRERFQVRRVSVVCDRGMMVSDNFSSAILCRFSSSCFDLDDLSFSKITIKSFNS